MEENSINEKVQDELKEIEGKNNMDSESSKYKEALDLIARKEEEDIKKAGDDLNSIIKAWSEKWNCSYIPVIMVKGNYVEHSIIVSKNK